MTRSSLKEFVPDFAVATLRSWRNKLRSTRSYEKLYESHARSNPPDSSIGDGDYEQIGRLEMALLIGEGLRPNSTLMDFGCGTGRLAQQVIPWMDGGRYIGIDISRTMLAHARSTANAIPDVRCAFEFVHQSGTAFSVREKSVDMVCVFSVFTHMEHEDSYKYLREIRKIVKDDGVLVFSCLPMELEMAKGIFREQADHDPVARWAGVRNVTTTRQFMEEIAAMAGWRTVRWYQGDEANLPDPVSGAMRCFGQSACVLTPA